MSKASIEKLSNIPQVDLGDYFLRAIEYKDYKDMFEYGSDPEVTKTLFWSYSKLEEAESSIQTVFLDRPKKGLPSAYAIVDKQLDKMIGTCDFHAVDWEKNQGEIGYALNRKYWGKGIMSKACKAVIEFGFDYLELDKILIAHAVNNPGSRRVIEKNGFVFLEEKYSERMKVNGRYYELKR